MLVVRPTVAYYFNATNGLVWLADPFRAIGFLRSCDFLASKHRPEGSANPQPALTINAKEPRNG